MSKNKKEKELWLTNTSTKKDISIGDLRITIRRGKSINILDSRHYSYTPEEIEKSMSEGSLFKRKNVVKVRQVEPVAVRKLLTVYGKPQFQKPLRSHVEIEEKYYEDLDIFKNNLSIEQLAEENADMEFQDNEPALSVDKSYKKD